MGILLTEAGIFLGYVLFVVSRVGILPSISDSWYALSKNQKPLFTVAFCYPVGILHCFHGSAAFFIAGAGLCFVGAATDFKSNWKTTAHVHATGAVVVIISSLIGLCMMGIFWPAVAIIVFIGIYANKDNFIWWIEIVAFASIIGGLIEFYLR